MSDDREDIAGLLRNEARIARAGDWPHPTCPDLLDRAADEIEARDDRIEAVSALVANLMANLGPHAIPDPFYRETTLGLLHKAAGYLAALAEPP